MKIGDKFQRPEGVTWEIVEIGSIEAKAVRITPIPFARASRRAPATEMFIPVEKRDPYHGYSPSVFTAVRDAVNSALMAHGPGSADALRRWIDERFPDVAKSLRDEALAGWLAHPSSIGPKPKTTNL